MHYPVGNVLADFNMLNKQWIVFLLILISLLFVNYLPIADASADSMISAEAVLQNQGVSVDCIAASDDDSEFVNDVIIPVGMEFLGAFLGILAALALNRYLEGRQYKELNRSLYQELQEVLADLSGHEKKEFYRYLTPLWDIYLASGQLALLASGRIHKEYLEIYSKIQYAQELEQEYIHSKLIAVDTKDFSNKDDFRERYIQTINKARNREASEVMQLIKKLPKESDDAGRRNHTK